MPSSSDEKVIMFPTNAYVIRQATVDDQGALRRLAELDGRRPLSGPVLLGEIGGFLGAAVSAARTGKSQPTRPSRPHSSSLGCRHRFREQRAFRDQPSLPARLKANMSEWKTRNHPVPYARALPDAGHADAMETKQARAA